jgi:hypothetical protein
MVLLIFFCAVTTTLAHINFTYNRERERERERGCRVRRTTKAKEIEGCREKKMEKKKSQRFTLVGGCRKKRKRLKTNNLAFMIYIYTITLRSRQAFARLRDLDVRRQAGV